MANGKSLMALTVKHGVNDSNNSNDSNNLGSLNAAKPRVEPVKRWVAGTTTCVAAGERE
jgi:hypothetical protein